MVGALLSISILWGSGVLVTCDGRSADPGYREPRSARPIVYSEGGREKALAIVSGYGDEALVEAAFQEAEDVFVEWFDAVGSKSWRSPGGTEVRRIVSQIEERLLERHRSLRSVGVAPRVYMALATVTQEGSPRLYYFDERGLSSPRHETPGYVVLGPPQAVSVSEAILRIFGYTPSESQALSLSTLSAFIIEAAAEVDPLVSPMVGESLLIRQDPAEKDVVISSLKEQVLLRLRERVSRRREAVKTAWRAMDMLGDEREERVLRLLRGLIERQGEGQGGSQQPS